jgi:hypothetical protein
MSLIGRVDADSTRRLVTCPVRGSKLKSVLNSWNSTAPSNFDTPPAGPANRSARRLERTRPMQANAIVEGF